MDRKQLRAVALAALTVLAVFAVGPVGTAGAAGSTTVSLAPDLVTTEAGSTTTVDIVVDSAANGVGSYDFTVSVGDTGVGRITDVSLGGNPGNSDVTIADDGSSATVQAIGADTADSGSVVIATVTVEGQTDGETPLDLTVDSLGDEDANSYTVDGTNGGTLNVGGEGVTDVRLSPTDRTVESGQEATYDVVVADAEDGVGSYDVRLSLDDPSVAEFTDVQFEGSPGRTGTEFSSDGSAVRIRAAGADTATGSVTVATVTVQGGDAGTAAVDLAVNAIGDENSDAYEIARVTGASVTTESTATATETATPPPDDGDDPTPTRTDDGDDTADDSDTTDDSDTSDGGDGGDGSGGGGGGGGGGSEPATFRITDAGVSPDSIVPGGTTTVGVTVVNPTDSPVFPTVEVLVDGAARDSREVALEPGERRTIEFDLTLESRGNRVIEVNDDSAGVVSVQPENVETVRRATIFDLDSDRPGVQVEVTGTTVSGISLPEGSDGELAVADLESVPEGTPEPPGRTVQAVRITVPDGLENADATVEFTLSRDRLDALGSDPAEIRLARFDDGEWETLETTVAFRSADSVGFAARTSGFSVFAVTAPEDTASPTPTSSPTPTATASPTPTATDSPTPSPTATASPSPTATASPTPTPTAGAGDTDATPTASTTLATGTETTESGGLPGFTLMTVLVALAALALLSRRR